MGKDQELLEAARTGNLASVNVILSGKLPRSSGTGGLTGGLRSLLALRPANVNCTDTNGETPLHLAALNGHKDVVLALLQAKASVTEVDNKGCTPLHLVAWNGHAQICKILLQHATDVSIVNVQTNEGETPLHFAAQHGHLEVVSLLLQNKADPTYRNLSERSALDMAAQYGKKEVVRTLLTGRPELLAHEAGQPSPLHLAAFNGHLPIVRFLLDQGFHVNTRTNNGTALHQAATSCKLDVIKLLLDRGVDVWAKADNGMTAEDILKTINSKLTKDALAIIGSHINNQRTPDSDGEKDVNGIPGPGAKTREVSPRGRPVPMPKPRSVFMGDHPETEHFPKVDSTRSDPSEPQSPPPPIPPRVSLRLVDSPHRDSMAGAETGQSHLSTDKGRSASRDASPMSGSREQPKKPPRKTPSMRRTEAGQSADSAASSGANTQLSTESQETSLADPAPSQYDQSRMDHYVNVDLDKLGSVYLPKTVGEAESQSVEGADSVIKSDGGGGEGGEKSEGGESSKEGRTAEQEDARNGAKRGNDEEVKVAKPQSLELDGSKKRESGGTEDDLPLSPSSYPQPPTPDCPPPSPSTALQGIQQKINPQEKRKSKDMETITESTLLLASATTQPGQMPSPQVTDTSQSSDTAPAPAPDAGSKAVTDEKVEDTADKKTEASASGDGNNTVEVLGETVQMRRSVSTGDNPVDWEGNVFAGLLRGSTPGGLRNVVSQICENVTVKTVRSKRRSTPSTIVTFDPLMEREEEARDLVDAERVLEEIDVLTAPAAGAGGEAGGPGGKPRGQRESYRAGDDAFDDSEEWAKIAATLETFGAGIARESVFVREYEASFAQRLAAGRQKIQSVGEWLESLGLGQYENTLVANGFDDTDFLGGKIIEDADLATIGISNSDHRAAIVSAAQRLPPVHPIDQKVLPESVESWLETLRLGQYLDTFVSHKYHTMQRVVKLWELELNTVLDISSLGHRKRILASLGDRPTERDNSLSPARVRRRGSDEEEPKSPFEHIDLYRDYTGVKSRAPDSVEQRSPVNSPLMSFDKDGENGPLSPQGIRDSQIHIRPPHLMHTTGSIKQWRHRPEILIKGCCNYTAHYLGSTIVKELKGATSTQEGIAKLKQRLRRKLQKSTEVINKIPTIMLSISYKGVKFIDAKSKKVICDHEIANIFCACQDGDHMNFFAYVTKDRETGKHYCHVFSVRSRELAGEIILTLGEAFEIAYQMALKERAEEDALQFERQLSHSDADDAASESSKASAGSVNTV